MNKTKINIKADCGNSPKSEFLKDFNIAFAEGNAEFILQSVSDDIHWQMIGDKEISGKEAFTKAIKEMAEYTADEITIHHVITHGKQGAANGEMLMDGKRYSFCDVYEFTSAAKNIIRRMYSYVVRTEI